MYVCPLPKPHYTKLTALAANRKLPDVDKPKVQEALARYATWVRTMDELDLEGPLC